MNEPGAHFDITLTVNGRRMSASAEARRSLSDFLRDDLGLTGTHIGCEHGACGACSVVVDGRLTRACLMLAVQADGCAVDTVEGLAQGDGLSPLQAAFKKHHALQCGFCTPGFLMAASELLKRTPDPDEHQVRDWLSGNICRCTGYQFIVDAVLDAAKHGRSK